MSPELKQVFAFLDWSIRVRLHIAGAQSLQPDHKLLLVSRVSSGLISYSLQSSGTVALGIRETASSLYTLTDVCADFFRVLSSRRGNNSAPPMRVRITTAQADCLT